MISSTTGFPSFTLELPQGRSWRIGPRPAILGILNVTPDSFSDGGRFSGPEAAVEAALRMIEEGADAIDIGGESTRPGADPVPAGEQLRRILPVLERLRPLTEVPISIDTRDPEVGCEVLACGADIINDVSALRDERWIPLLAGRPVPVILMHMRGTPKDMQALTDYPRGVVEEVVAFLERRIADLRRAGIAPERTVVDPGIGFAKTARQNLEILRGLGALKRLGRPVLAGLSRKIFLGRVLAARPGASERLRDPAERDVATVAANAYALLEGASILRVHNVPYTRDLVDVFTALYVEGAGG